MLRLDGRLLTSQDLMVLRSPPANISDIATTADGHLIVQYGNVTAEKASLSIHKTVTKSVPK